ncbi:MAG: hypothetical protein FWE27_01080 [Defluviitaleaceae bacterium]|nr:hypothetical protein [Defluviitaleaceae bacterium]
MSIYKDRDLLKKCIEREATDLFPASVCCHPLDEEVVRKLQNLWSKFDTDSDDFRIFKFRKEFIDPLWKMLIEKAIKCLRYYDTREPFSGNPGQKVPKAYGIVEIKKYYDQYTDFESVLYGANSYYRDHVVHVFRTWLLGVRLLVKNNGEYLNEIKLHEKDMDVALENSEKLSMWTIIALTHDLGYPLQKAKSIIDTTKSMVSTFISNPDISLDFSFHGVQNYMNDFIVRLMSSRMRKSDKNEQTDVEEAESMYAARLQPKYYFKFLKSLEENQHGILSTLIIYKLLTYFIESDFNINEDYLFDEDDARQFYIRREILRAIASHTCDDVYQLYMTSFSFLLRICDDAQEWGRKNITELYVKSAKVYELIKLDFIFDNANASHNCIVEEKLEISDEQDAVISAINRFRKQALVYVMIFRDGQDTVSRDFSFERKLTIKCSGLVINLSLEIPKESKSELSVTIEYVSDGNTNKKFSKEFFKDIKGIEEQFKIVDRNDSVVDENSYQEWKTGTFTISLLE